MDNGYNLADIAAASGKNNDVFGGGSGVWIFALLILALMGGGFGSWGNRCGTNDTATTQDVYSATQRASDFAALERQNNEGVAATRQAAYDIMSSVKDASYANLSETRDLQAAVNAGFAAQQQCCCETNRNIDSVRFDMANYSAAIQANDTANTQKILDAMATNRMADMQNQINGLQLQLATCGVVKYPSASTYYAGVNPFCGGGGCCNGGNI